jgi:hypothetical protein
VSAQSRPGAGSLVVLLVAHCLILFPMGLMRLVDGDEGYYLLAVKLIQQGHLPYHDFFYTQMPLLPYFYALCLAPIGTSWYAARVVTVVLALGIGFGIWTAARMTCRRPALAFVAVLLYLTSAFCLEWFTVVKTYALSTLLLLGTDLVLRSRSILPRRALFFAGLLFGLAIDSRSMMCAALPGFALGAVEREKGHVARSLSWFAIGIVVALIPMLYFFARSPDGFAFGNFGYHAIRSSYGWAANLKQKASVLAALLGLHNPEGTPAVQFQVLTLFVLLYVASSVARKVRPDFGLYVVLFVGLGSILPTPSFPQYYSVVLPFMILMAIRWLDEVWSPPTGAASPWLFAHRTAAIALIAMYVVAAPVHAYHFVISGQQVPGVSGAPDAKNWRIETLRRISSEIDAHNPGHRPFLTFWPGYAVESESPVVAGLENHFGLLVAHQLDATRRRRLILMSTDEVGRQIDEGDRLVVLGNWVDRESWRPRLAAAGYRVVARVEDAEISAKRSRP